MSDFTKAKYAQLVDQDGHFIVTLLDENRQPVGYGYRGPTIKRAQQDMKYWTREKGLEELPA